MKSSHRDKDFEFTIDVPESHIFNGSHAHLDDVLENLIENACKWCKTNFRLTSYVAAHPITGRGQLSIVIEDDGPGIPEEQRMFVLGRGNRADEETPGTGLGLDIVRRIATDYGGEILLSTSELGGLSVTVILPGEAT
jgi:signal transduction histidine kinase